MVWQPLEGPSQVGYLRGGLSAGGRCFLRTAQRHD